MTKLVILSPNWWFLVKIDNFWPKLITLSRKWRFWVELGKFWPKLFILWQNLSFWWVINISLVAHEILRFSQKFVSDGNKWIGLWIGLSWMFLAIQCKWQRFFNCLIVIKPNDILFSMLSLLLKCFNFLMQMWHSKIIKFWKW